MPDSIPPEPDKILIELAGLMKVVRSIIGDTSQNTRLSPRERKSLNVAVARVGGNAEMLQDIPPHERVGEDYAPICLNLRLLLNELKTVHFITLKGFEKDLHNWVVKVEDTCDLPPPLIPRERR